MNYVRLAAAGTHTIKAQTDLDRQILITKLRFTANGTGTVTISDGTTSFVFDVAAGMTDDFCWGLVFAGTADVTFTVATATVSIFWEHTYKP